MVVTNNQTLVDKIRRLSVFGRITEYSNKSGNSFISKFIDVGYNYKMSDITAAVGVAQMEKLNKIIKRKRALAKYWDEKLQEIEYIEPPYVSENTKHIYQSYVALVDRCINRNKLIEALMKKGIQTQIGTYASHIQPVYNSNQKCPNSLEIFNRSVALPIYYMLRKGDIDIAATILKNTLKDLRRV
jgi:dTDP-4-amino-4,6-dideoxygalactose transaminase